MIVFFLFWIIQHVAHIAAFTKGLTPFTGAAIVAGIVVFLF